MNKPLIPQLEDGTPLLIREYRKRKGMTLKQLADKIHTTPQTIQRLETANMTVSVVWLDRIATALGVEAHTLLGSTALRTPAQSRDDSFVQSMLDELGRSRYNTPVNAQLMLRISRAFGELSDALLDWQIGIAKVDKVESAAQTMAALVMRIALDGDDAINKRLKTRDVVTPDHEDAAA